MQILTLCVLVNVLISLKTAAFFYVRPTWIGRGEKKQRVALLWSIPCNVWCGENPPVFSFVLDVLLLLLFLTNTRVNLNLCKHNFNLLILSFSPRPIVLCVVYWIQHFPIRMCLPHCNTAKQAPATVSFFLCPGNTQMCVFIWVWLDLFIVYLELQPQGEFYCRRPFQTSKTSMVNVRFWGLDSQEKRFKAAVLLQAYQSCREKAIEGVRGEGQRLH